MDSFGCFIKTEREKKGISLEEISAATKINPHLLEALESDHVEELPAPAFVKGFVRNYAKCLGLDPKEIVYRYLDFITNSDAVITDSFIEGGRLQGGKIGFDQNKILIRVKQIGHKRALSILLIFTFILGIWFSWSLFLKRTSISMQDLRINQPPSSIDELIQGKLEVEGPIDGPLESGHEFISVSMSEALSSMPSGTDTQIETDPQILLPKKELIIAALDETWIDIKIDDNRHYDLIMRPGDVIKLESQSSCHLWIGNAGGIEITYEGESLGHLGEDGEVIRLRFPL